MLVTCAYWIPFCLTHLPFLGVSGPLFSISRWVFCVMSLSASILSEGAFILQSPLTLHSHCTAQPFYCWSGEIRWDSTALPVLKLTFFVWALAGFFISCVFWSHRLNYIVSSMGLISALGYCNNYNRSFGCCKQHPITSATWQKNLLGKVYPGPLIRTLNWVLGY
jgi:hypothetical protein